MSNKCNNCKKQNPTQEYKTCPTCRALWRKYAKRKPGKYKLLYENMRLKT